MGPISSKTASFCVPRAEEERKPAPSGGGRGEGLERLE